MPRSIKRPQVGQIVWYNATSPPTGQVSAALIVNRVSNVLFGLYVFDRANGAPTYVASVPYVDGTRPASGPWFTHMRVQEPVAGAWPKDGGSEGPLGTGGVVVT